VCALLLDAGRSPWVPVGPGVDYVEHGVGRLGWHEAERVLQDRVHDRVQPILGEGFVVVLGPPDVDVAQPGLGAPGQVGDQAGRPFRAEALLDAVVGLAPTPGTACSSPTRTGRTPAPAICWLRVPGFAAQRRRAGPSTSPWASLALCGLAVGRRRLTAQIPAVLDTDGMGTRLGRAEQVARNRQLVLAAARRVFLAQGYASATLDAIAEEAGFSKGVVYSQFESKADMFLALLEARISERAEQNERLAVQFDGRQLAEAVPQLALALRRAEPEWTQLVLEFRLHAARVPELNRRYAELHEHTVRRLARVFSRLHERAGSTPDYPPLVMAKMALAINVGTFLEQMADAAAVDLPATEVISELVLHTAPPAGGGQLRS
jgi:AcrR family transcriptional regulator